MRQLGAKGVISDISPFDTNVDSWTDALNIRFNNGHAEKIRGHIPVFQHNRLGHEDEIPMHLTRVPLSDSEWLYFTKNAVWKTNGFSHTLMTDSTDTPISVPYDAPWNSTTVGNSIIANSTQLRRPIGLANGESKFKYLPKWGPWDANVMRSFKNFAMAIGAGDGFPQRVRWSNIIPPNALPADWGWEVTYDAQGNATQGAFIDGSAGGYNDLSFANGKLLDGLSLRDQFIIYSDVEVISCQYVGGIEIFRFNLLFDDGGALNSDCICTFNNKHFVVAPNDIYIHNGSTKESIINDKIRIKLLDELTANSYTSVKVVPYLTENEIWVIYAGADAEGLDGSETMEATKAAVYNFVEGTWSFIEIPRTLDIKLGPVSLFFDENGNPTQTVAFWGQTDSEADPGQPPKLSEFSNMEWEEVVELWNLAGAGSSQNFKDQALLCASADGGFYILDRGNYFTFLVKEGEGEEAKYVNKREDIISVLTKDYIDLDEVLETPDYKTVLEIWPQTMGSGELYFQVGGSATSGGDIAYDSGTRFVCSKDRKVDIRENHRYLCLKIQGRGVGDWSFSGFDATIRSGGRR